MDELGLKLARKVVIRYASQEEVKHLSDARDLFREVERYLAGFPRVLAKAHREDRTGLNPGEVWQDEFSKWWKSWHPIHEQLRDVADELDDLGGDFERNLARYRVMEHIKDMTSDKSGHSSYDPTDKKQLSYAFGNPLHRPHPTMGRDHIAYEEERLEDWAKAATKWAKEGQALAKKALTKAKRSR